MIPSFWIAYDLDATTLCYESAFRRFCGQHFGIPEDKWMECFPPADDYDYSQCGWYGMKNRQEFMDLHALAVESGMLSNMDIYEHARDVMWRLRDKGCKSSIVTARYLKTGDHHVVNETTSLSLDRHDLPVDELHVTAEKVRVLADVYFDDAPHNIEVLRAAGRTVIIADQLYNRHLDGLRAHNWLEFEEIILQLLAEREAAFKDLTSV